MRMQSKDQVIQLISVERASSNLLDSLKNLFANLFAAKETSEVMALNLLQDSKGFDPLRNPQSLVNPKSAPHERMVVPDKRLPIRKAA